ncbi:MAG: hypothetical protein WCT01_03865 [Candidatus Shapirobacteria bacterium]|jgi:hypothetical protein
MKLIVIGASLTGKTTLIKYLRSSSTHPISEMDEELTALNNGQYPTNTKYKHQVLAPKIINQVLLNPNIIFFTNTDYFTLNDLQQAKINGFKIVQLNLSLSELQKRNENRAKNEGYTDLSQWLPGMMEYQTKVFNANLVDKVIDASEPTSEIAQKLLTI